MKRSGAAEIVASRDCGEAGLASGVGGDFLGRAKARQYKQRSDATRDPSDQRTLLSAAGLQRSAPRRPRTPCAQIVGSFQDDGERAWAKDKKVRVDL
jgi:hypothetical protein